MSITSPCAEASLASTGASFPVQWAGGGSRAAVRWRNATANAVAATAGCAILRYRHSTLMSQYIDSRQLAVRFRPGSWLIVPASALGACIFGWLLASLPLVAILPVAFIAVVPLLVSPRVRVLFVVFGSSAIFQSSSGLSPPKIAFLLGVAAAFAATLLRLSALSRGPAYPTLIPVLRAAVVIFAMIVVSLPVSTFHDVTFKAWLRDAAPYLLFAFAPFFALEAQAAFSGRALKRILVVAGLISALSFSARWLTNHGIAELPVSQLGLPSLLLAGSLFAYGTALLLHGRRAQLRWLALTSLVFVALISTGTRAAFVVLAAPVAIVLGARPQFGRRLVRLAIIVPVAGVFVFAGFQAILRGTDANQNAFSKRVSILLSSGDTSQDRSYVDRVAQTSSAWRVFRTSPLVGVGPGHPIPWRDSFGVPQPPTANVDSSVAFLTKFGLVGIAVALFLGFSTASTVRRMMRRTGSPTVAQLALTGFGAIVVGAAVLTVPFEDKGLSTGFLLLLAIAAREVADAAISTPGDPRG